MSNDVVNSLLEAYRAGFFPMADPEDPIPGRVAWLHPDPRAIIPIGDDEAGSFRVARSLAQRVRSGRFEIRADTTFRAVIEACATIRGAEETWISPEIVDAYCAMHEAGHAHSVEAWLCDARGARLVGGLYGVAINGLFAGESMFSLPEAGGTDASKVCLVHLVRHMEERGMTLLDTQFWNPHLEQFGCVQVSREDYVRRLEAAIRLDVSFEPFDPAAGRRAG